jgi:hypothetical protein
MNSTLLLYFFNRSFIALVIIILALLPVASAQAAGKEIVINFDDCVHFLTNSKPEKIARFEQDYGLNDQQKAGLKTALDSYQSEMEVVRSGSLSNEDRRDRKTNAIKKFNTEVEGLLTTDQRSLLLENTKKQRLDAAAAAAKAKEKAKDKEKLPPAKP